MTRVIDAIDLFGGQAPQQRVEPQQPSEPAPAAAPSTASKPMRSSVDLSTIRAQLEARLIFINDELQRLDALVSERTKIERLLDAIGD